MFPVGGIGGSGKTPFLPIDLTVKFTGRVFRVAA